MFKVEGIVAASWHTVRVRRENSRISMKTSAFGNVKKGAPGINSLRDNDLADSIEVKS